MSTFFVYNKCYTGKCYWTEKRSRITSVFTYDENYLSGDDNWNIDPTLSLTTGAQASRNGLPGVFRDAAPDRWGQNLIRHRHLQKSKKSGKTPRTVNEVDYLLGVNDSSRQGDLRFSLERDGIFQHPSYDIPKLVALPKLLSAANQYTASTDENAITYLLEAASASLGGARPKAAVYDGDDLYIAKFPHKQDQWDVIAWEWVCLSVAKEAGVCVPENSLVKVNDQNVLLIKRFDRLGAKRIGYISAMTLLDLTDGENADYVEIADELRNVSVSANKDLHELYRRIILNLFVNNTDDHLRNHGLLRSGSGWRLSPVFDVNLNPDTTAVRVTSIFTEVKKEAALEALSDNAQAFNLSQQDAEIILSEVISAVKSCEKYAYQAGIKKEECTRMLHAIELV